ncbi:MAG: cyclase family protein [Candidatus Hydrogenedentes bacterium]|nr:cyclase family protein [Candidatus Hydrogenedentota bacterium]
MPVKWIDVSIPLRPATTVWPGDPHFEFTPMGRIAEGDSCNTSRVSMATHTGTHIDAPWHFDDRGPRLDQIDPDVFFGQATLFDVPRVSVVTASDLGAGLLPPRILIKTRNSGIPCEGPFHEDFAGLAGDAAQRLVDEHVRLVGIDYLSIGPFKQEGHDTHRILLGHNIPCVEGLRLGGLRPGLYEFIVLPLHIPGADGAPCRAFARLEEVQ